MTARRSWRGAGRYGAAAALSAVGLLLTWVMFDAGADTMSPLVGAIVVATWLLGVGPGGAAVIIGWAAAWPLLFPDAGPGHVSRIDLLRWLGSLLVAVAVLGLNSALRRGRSEATLRAEHAERERVTTETIQDLAAALSSAVTPPDVAHVLVEGMPSLLGAEGAALGLVRDDALEIVDPEGAPMQTLSPGMRLDLESRTPITAAARTGRVAQATSRAAFERAFPDGARLAPGAEGALAVPLMGGGRVVGAMGFPFRHGSTIDDRVISLARVAASLGGQALDRATLFEQERLSRTTLDRISRLAPRFGSESPEVVARMACREARIALGADVAHIWAVEESSYVVTWRDPSSAALPPGTRIDPADIPGLESAIERLETMFIADSLVDVKGRVLEHAREHGIRSSLRVPVVVAGAAARVLVLQWTSVQSPPSPSELVLTRRFADQAGIALEHAERRVAQDLATARAAETRRLLDLTKALASALEPHAVANVALEEASRALEAAAGAVVRLIPGGRLELIATRGDVGGLRALARVEMGEDSPLAEAMRTGELVLAVGRSLLPGAGSRAEPLVSVAIPLVAGGSIVGGVELKRATASDLSEAACSFALSLSKQAGQALERASLLEREHDARMRAERMASDLAQLHALTTALGRASTTGEVAELICTHVTSVLDGRCASALLTEPTASPVALAALVEGLGIARATPDAVGEVLEAATRTRAVTWHGRGNAHDGHRGRVGAVPLLVGQRVTGVLVVVFEGGDESSEDDVQIVESIARQAAQPLARVQLLEEERASRLELERAHGRLQRLQAVTESLAAAPTTLVVTEVAVQEGRVALAADGAVLHLSGPTDDELLLVAVSGAADGMRPRIVPEATGGPIAEAHLTASAVEIEQLDGETAEGLVPASSGGVGALRAIPLTAGGRSLGVLTLTFASPQRFDRDDRVTGAMLGRQCALALERSRILEEERVARQRSERLQALTTALSSALTATEVVEILLEQLGSALGVRRATVGLVDHEGSLPDDEGWLGDRDLLREPPIAREAGTGTSLDDVLITGRSAYLDGAELRASTIAIVPLLSGRRAYAVAVLYWEGTVAPDVDERSLVETFASQCAQAIDRAQRYEVERTIAETLQRSVLPETIPSVEGATVAARYLPGTAAIDVGGDWFDTIPLGDGRLAFVVGDVMGKGVPAASTMGQLRNGMRALALDLSDPAAIVTKLNRLLEGFAHASFVTLAMVVVDPSTFAAEIVSAGHLPPVLLGGDRRVSFLNGGQSLPLGVEPDVEYHADRITLDPGSTIILYTDGLVERRDRSLDDGLRELAAALDGVRLDPDGVVDLLIDRLLGQRVLGDDVAVLAVALDEVPLGPFYFELSAELHALVRLRSALSSWLERGGIPESDRRDVMLATWEASANAIEHARRPTAATIDVRAALSGDRVHVEVVDSGAWAEPSLRPDRGLGLQLIQALMTHVSVEPSPTGTRVVMELVLRRERAGDGDTDRGAG